MDIQLRPFRPSDTDVVASIVFEAFGSIAKKHNFPPDFPVPEAAQGLAKAFMTHAKWWGVVAEADGRVVGSNFLDQRDPIATVGPLTVDPNFHGKGVGRRLMEAVIARAAETGAPGTRLVQDAFNTTSLSLYASLGFELKEPLALMTGKLRAPSPGTVRSMTAADVPACVDLCRRVHGFERGGELADSVNMFRPLLLEREGRVVAYASAPTFWFINHGVAETDRDMQELLAGASALTSEPLALLVPIRRATFFKWCLAQGLRVVKPMGLMAMGTYHDPRGAFYPSVQC